MKIKGKKFSLFVGTAMAVIVTVVLLLGGCPGADSGNEDTITAAIPGAPTIISLTPGDEQVKVAWTAPADNGGAVIIGYSIYYSTNAGDGTNGTKVDAGNATEFVVSGLTNGTEYYFVVTATNSVGEGAISGEESAIPSATVAVPDAPTGLTLTPGEGQVTVKWTAPTNNGGAPIIGYYIYYSETQGSGKNGTKVDAGDVTEFAVSGLTNGTTYYFVVTATNSEGEGEASDELNAIPATVPDAPTDVTLTSGNKQVTVTWTAPAFNGGADISGYYIYYSENTGEGTSGIKVDTGDVTEFVVSGLTNGVTYYFTVTAVNSVGESATSVEQNAAPVATVPGSPIIVSLTPGDKQVAVAWTAPANDGGETITGYSIYFSESSGDGISGTKVDAGNVMEYVVSGLTNGETYYFVVTATNAVGEGTTSGEESAIPSATATVPDAPTGLKLTPGDEQVTVAWSAPANNGGQPITGYYIYYSETQGSGTGGTQIDVGNVTEYIVSSLINGTTYYFVVTAANSVGESVASDEQSAIPPTVPDAPKIESLTPGNQQVTVAWTAPAFNGGADITGYFIYYSENSGDGTNGTKVDAGYVTEYVVSGLTNGETYYFAVTAINAKGESALSDEQNIVPAAKVPGAPTGVILKPKPGEVKVSWTAPEDNGGADIIGYYIYYSRTEGVGKSGTKIDAGNVTEYVVSGLLSYRVYFFTVTAVNSVGESAASGEQRAATDSYPPDAPTITSLTPGVGKVTVAWTAPEYDGGAGITGYNIYYSETQGSGKSGKKINVGNVTSFVITGLTNGKTYYFIVTAVNHHGDSAASDEKYATPAATYPEAPIGLTLTPGNRQVTVTWTAPVNNGGVAITGYYIYYSENSGDGTSGTKVNAGNVTDYVVSGLTNGSTYYFVVTAVNAVGESVPSVEQNAIPATVPGKPTDVIAEVTGIGEITVSWNVPDSNGGVEITEYRVYWGTSTEFTRDLTDSRNTTDVTTRKLAIQNLTPGTPYYFAVTAYNLVGEGDASEEVSAMAATVPGYPTVVSAELTGNGVITVTWTPPLSDGGSPITEYRVYWTVYDPDTLKSQPLERINSKATQDGLSTELVIGIEDDLKPGTYYQFFVNAFNAVGGVDFNTFKYGDNRLNNKIAQLLNLPDAPTLNSVSLTSTAQQVRVTWTAPVSDGGTAITRYTVYWATSPDFETASAIGNKIINTVTTRETLIDGLTIGTAYYFVITATNERGEGKASNEKSATPAQISSLITSIILTIDSQDYTIAFNGPSVSVDIDAMATMATVKEVTLEAGASGLAIDDELTISKGVATIPITDDDGSTREHIIHFRNPRITIGATQLEIVDGSKTDGTKKLPSQFIVFDITTEATIPSQYNVEFLLVKDGSTAPTTMEEFRKAIPMLSNRANAYPNPETDISMAYKSALFPKPDRTSLYLAYDSEGNYPLNPDTSYTLYAVQPQATDTKPVSLGDFRTGTVVDMSENTLPKILESPNTASISGKYYMTADQFMVFYVLYGDDWSSLFKFRILTSSDDQGQVPLKINNDGLVELNPNYWYNMETSNLKPSWRVIACKHNRSIFEVTTRSGDKYYNLTPTYILELNFNIYNLTFHLFEN